MDDRVLTAKPTVLRIVGVLCAGLFLTLSATSWWAGQVEVVPVFILFVALGVMLIIGPGRVEMTSETVAYVTLWSRHEVKWTEIQYVEVAQGGGSIAFRGRGRDVIAVGPSYWGGLDGRTMKVLLEEKAQAGLFRIENSQAALLRSSRGVKK